MAKRKKDSDLGIVKPSMAIVGGGVVLGVGSSIVGGVGGSTAAGAQGGLVAASSFLPVAGTAIGAGLTLRQLRNLEEQTKRKRR